MKVTKVWQIWRVDASLPNYTANCIIHQSQTNFFSDFQNLVPPNFHHLHTMYIMRFVQFSILIVLWVLGFLYVHIILALVIYVSFQSYF